jgi:hypothetical protein
MRVIYDTLKCDFYTQSIIFTPIVILTFTTDFNPLFNTYECDYDIYTHELNFNTMSCDFNTKQLN